MNKIKRVSISQLKLLQRLNQKKYREEFRKFIVEGAHLVEEVLSSPWEAESLYLRTDAYEEKRFESIIRTAEAKGIDLQLIGPKEFERAADTVTSQGILAVVRMQEEKRVVEWGGGQQRFIAVALNNITDPGNLGTIIRTCAWFGVDLMLLDRGSVEIFNPKVVRAAMGALFHLPIATNSNLEEEIFEARRNGVAVYSTTLRGSVQLNDCSFKNRVLLLLGNESHGLDEQLQASADVSLLIPKIGTGDSLNVAVACGVMLQKVVSTIR